MKNKVNILLIVLLTALIGALGFFGYKLIFQKDKILVPNFTDATMSDINTWCSNLENNPCSFEYEYSDSVEKDHLIYQSISADEEVSDSITFIISLGKNLNLPIPEIKEETTIEDIEKWAKDNGLLNVSYVAKESDKVEKNHIISISPTVIDNVETIVTVTYSSGSKDSTDGITVEYGSMLDISEEDFKTKTKKMGLTPEYDKEKDDYSSKVKKGNIIWHGSGIYEKNEVIHYGLSKGVDENAIVVEKFDYVGLSLDDFKDKVSKLGTKGLVANHKESMDAYSSSVAKGNIVEHGSGSYIDEEMISYGLSLGEKEGEIIVTDGSYVGSTLETFETKTKALNLKPTHRDSWDVEDNKKTAGTIAKHGTGSYEKDEEISYGVYVSTTKIDEKEYDIKSTKYAGKTYEEFEKAVKLLGLNPVHRSEWDVKDNTKTNRTIARNGEGIYEKGENISYGLYISDGSTEIPTTGIVNISANQFSGLTLSEFKSKVEKLGLTAEKSSSHADDYSSTYAEGTILWHGSGTWDISDPTDRVIHYSLSKGSKSQTPTKTVTVATGHENDSEANFKSYINGLGLTCSKSGTTYSSTVAKGGIIYSAGTYNEGSNVAYYISDGPDTRTSVTSYAGKTEAEFKSFLTSKGLVAGSVTSEDCATVEIGSIVRNDTGTFNKGDSVNYILSTGITLPSFDTIAQPNEVSGSYDATKSNIDKYLKGIGFTNISFNGVAGSNNDDSIGIVKAITVGGSQIPTSPTKFSYNVAIVISISDRQE